MSKVRRKSAHFIPSSSQKDTHNPFPDLSQTSFYDTKKSPKIPKRVGKCLQLMLICQKLLKPFNSPSKSTQVDAPKKSNITREKSKSAHEINQPDRYANSPRSECHCTALKSRNIDECILNKIEYLPDICPKILNDEYDNNQGSEGFPYEIDDSLKDGFWDLDIDSAIVGDFNSTSNLSLNDDIDPHYTTIQISSDGRVIHRVRPASKQVFTTSNHPDDKTSCGYSNSSSPKSGIYSKIIKPKENQFFYPPKNDLYPSYTGSRLNFERIMAIRNQLGLCQDFGRSVVVDDGTRIKGTPDLPRRNYGSSVVNYINELRLQGASQQSRTNISCNNPSPVFLDGEVAAIDTYAPIWAAKAPYCDTSLESQGKFTPEVVVVNRSVSKVLHQLNPIFCDDSSESASNISVNSPSRMMLFNTRDRGERFQYEPRPISNEQRRYETLYSLRDAHAGRGVNGRHG